MEPGSPLGSPVGKNTPPPREPFALPPPPTPSTFQGSPAVARPEAGVVVPPLPPPPPPPPLPEEEDRRRRREREDELLAAVVEYQESLAQLVAAPPSVPDTSLVPVGLSLRRLSVPRDRVDVPGVGLLRRMSLQSFYLRSIYNSLNGHSTPITYQDVMNRLLGTRYRDEFAGWGPHPVPGHDQLGVFPMMVDREGREYFSGMRYDETRDPSPPPPTLDLMVRIPRTVTRKQNESMRPSPQVGFPEPNDVLFLSPCAAPFFPFSWDPIQSDLVVSTPQNYAAGVEFYRAVPREIPTRVLSTDDSRTSTCSVMVRPISTRDLVMHLIKLDAIHQEWCVQVSDLFLAMGKSRVPAIEFIVMCEYLEKTWLPRMMNWVRGSV